jgi:hypothetical protein
MPNREQTQESRNRFWESEISSDCARFLMRASAASWQRLGWFFAESCELKAAESLWWSSLASPLAAS